MMLDAASRHTAHVVPPDDQWPSVAFTHRHVPHTLCPWRSPCSQVLCAFRLILGGPSFGGGNVVLQSRRIDRPGYVS
jgi:hypothetical protein